MKEVEDDDRKGVRGGGLRNFNRGGSSSGLLSPLPTEKNCFALLQCKSKTCRVKMRMCWRAFSGAACKGGSVEKYTEFHFLSDATARGGGVCQRSAAAGALIVGNRSPRGGFLLAAKSITGEPLLPANGRTLAGFEGRGPVFAYD